MPHAFADQQGVLLGEEVTIDGTTLATVRIGQSPTDNTSFNRSQDNIVQSARSEVFGGDIPDKVSREQVARFIAAFGRHAVQYGWHKQRPSFLAQQDMTFIDSAIQWASAWVRSNRASIGR